MSDYLGQRLLLPISRVDGRGAWLRLGGGGRRTRPDDEADHVPDEVLLPGGEMPNGARVGQKLEVFIYLDSEDRPIATTREPLLVAGEVSFLQCVDSTPIGAFVDWGLPKDLLVPFREQTAPMEVGRSYPVALYVDDTGRLAGSTKVGDFLFVGGDFEVGEWVEGVAWREEPELGWFVILEKAYLALLPTTEVARLTPGETVRFRVAHVLPDGKIEVSMRGLAHTEIERDAERLFELLGSTHAPRLGDHTDAEVIRELLGISKKAFKRAAGRLLKRGVVEIDRDGHLTPRAAPKIEVASGKPPPKGGGSQRGAAGGKASSSPSKGGGSQRGAAAGKASSGPAKGAGKRPARPAGKGSRGPDVKDPTSRR